MDLCAAPLVRLTPPSEGKILLHACCAPCSSAILECMVQNGLRPTVFFSNSNITPLAEYELRKAELTRYCESLGLEWVDDDYDHDEWIRQVGRGREAEPERGSRCAACFRFRLARAAAYASHHGFAVLTTTLASSRWKNLDQVNQAGESACSAFTTDARSSDPEHAAPVTWWPMNWRKGGLQPRRSELIRELGFYNQTFCGCEYSHPDTEEPCPEAPNQSPALR